MSFNDCYQWVTVTSHPCNIHVCTSFVTHIRSSAASRAFHHAIMSFYADAKLPYTSLESFTDLGPSDVSLQFRDGALLVHKSVLDMYSKVLRSVLASTHREKKVGHSNMLQMHQQSLVRYGLGRVFWNNCAQGFAITLLCTFRVADIASSTQYQGM